jgi:hypothetical protein
MYLADYVRLAEVLASSTLHPLVIRMVSRFRDSSILFCLPSWISSLLMAGNAVWSVLLFNLPSHFPILVTWKP